MAESFWTGAGRGTGGDTPVIRHAADHESYCYLDGRHSDLMGHGNFVVVPRANSDGTSPGFDVEDPGTIHVDPDAPDGGAIVNLSNLQERDVLSAVATSQYPHQAFYKLGESSPGTTRMLAGGHSAPDSESPGQQFMLPRVNSRAPGGYVVPASGPDGAQLQAQEAQAMDRLPRRHRPSALHEVGSPQLEQQLYAAPQPPPPPYQPQAYQPPPMYQQPYQPMQPDPQMAAALHGLTQMVHQLGQRMDAMGQPVMAPTRAPGMQIAGAPPASTEPMQIPRITRRRHAEQSEAPQTLDEYRELGRDEDNGKAVIAGFETLKIPFINGPTAGKARSQAFFSLSNGAKMSATFHGIVEAKTCVVLVYDTRYEDGVQFMPPEALDGPIQLTVAASKKEYSVLSVGTVFRLGVLDFIVLPIDDRIHEEAV